MGTEEKWNQGRAVVTGALGGAKVNSSLAALIATWHGRDVDAYSEESLIAIADIDSLLELNAADRTRLAEAIQRNGELKAANQAACERAEKLQERNDNQATTIASYETQHKAAMAAAQDIVDKAEESDKRYRAESLRCNELQNRNDNQAATIRAFDTELKALRPLGAELDECREALKETATNREEWKAESRIQAIRADNAERDCELARRQRNTEIDRANKAEAALHRLMTELGGLTLSMLPKGAYGGALADAYCDIKRDNPPSMRNLKAAAPLTLKAELLGTLDSVAEGLIDGADALDLIRLYADRL